MNTNERALQLHEEHKGKIEIASKVEVKNADDLSLVYTPGVAEASRKIAENTENVWKYTARGNWVAVVSDGTAVLGLGDIGPEAALPVMEGKAILFKQFGGVDAFPICVNTKDTDEIVALVKQIAPSFGGVNLEDIAAPKCFEIEARLKEELDIPVFHDDQHGTAIVVYGGLLNAVKVVQKDIRTARIVISGSGAAGIAIAKLLLAAGATSIIMTDSRGILSSDRSDLNPAKQAMLKTTNQENISGSLADAMNNSDIFIGVSAPGIVDEAMVKSMNENAIVFAMANPVPEIMPDLAKNAGAAIVATGRSDFANQVNNALVFPGFFKGLFASGSREITEKMKLAAGGALAALLENPEPEKIIPSIYDDGVADAIAKAVQDAS